MSDLVSKLAQKIDDAVPDDDCFVDLKELIERVLREAGLSELIVAGEAMRENPGMLGEPTSKPICVYREVASEHCNDRLFLASRNGIERVGSSTKSLGCGAR